MARPRVSGRFLRITDRIIVRATSAGLARLEAASNMHKRDGGIRSFPLLLGECSMEPVSGGLFLLRHATQRRSCRVYWSIFTPALIERINLRPRLETRVNQCALQRCNRSSFPYFCRPEHASSNQSSSPAKQAHFASNARSGSTRAFAHTLISPLSPSAIAV